jgi:hypothetical protein
MSGRHETDPVRSAISQSHQPTPPSIFLSARGRSPRALAAPPRGEPAHGRPADAPPQPALPTAIDWTRPRKSGSHRTPRWRKADSNCWSPASRAISQRLRRLVGFDGARIWRHVRPLRRALFRELGPAGTDQAIGVFGGHLESPLQIFTNLGDVIHHGVTSAE